MLTLARPLGAPVKTTVVAARAAIGKVAATSIPALVAASVAFVVPQAVAGAGGAKGGVGGAPVVRGGVSAWVMPAGQDYVRPRVKMTLPWSVPPSPRFLRAGVCGVNTSVDSLYCARTIVRAIDDARKVEPLPAIPSSFNLRAFLKLSYAEQLFAIIDIERTARGEPAIAGMTLQLDKLAWSAAFGLRDPSTPLPLRLAGGGVATMYGSNWAGGTSNALGSDYFWMYDDGLHSPNMQCSYAGAPGCWGHRENVLGAYYAGAYCPRGAQIHAVMGASQLDTRTWSPSIAEITVNDCGPLPTMYFTWPDVQRLVFGR
jgi:hypothetical protein